MATGTVAVLMKIGFISEEMTKPRQLSGVSKILFSTVAVAYSYFFLHIAVFGPPVSEIFKGTFFMGVAVMSLLLFKSRQSSLREGFVWLDEFFALVSMVMLMGAIAVLFHWAVGGQEYFWRRYVTETVWIVGIIGGVVGGALYFLRHIEVAEAMV